MAIKNGQPIDASDFVITVVAGEALTALDAVYISSSDGKAYKCDADDTTKLGFVGFVQETTSMGGNVAIIHSGQVTGMSGLTAGGHYYLSGTAGAITTTAPTNRRKVGIAVSTTVLKILQNDTRQLVSYTADGTFTVPAGVTRIRIRIWGAGGGSSGTTDTDNTATANQNTSDGFRGTYAECIAQVAEGDVMNVDIGAGGTGSGNFSFRSGNAGANTSVIDNAGAGFLSVVVTSSSGGGYGSLTASGSKLIANTSIEIAGGGVNGGVMPTPNNSSNQTGGTGGDGKVAIECL